MEKQDQKMLWCALFAAEMHARTTHFPADVIFAAEATEDRLNTVMELASGHHPHSSRLISGRFGDLFNPSGKYYEKIEKKQS